MSSLAAAIRTESVTLGSAQIKLSAMLSELFFIEIQPKLGGDDMPIFSDGYALLVAHSIDDDASVEERAADYKRLAPSDQLKLLQAAFRVNGLDNGDADDPFDGPSRGEVSNSTSRVKSAK